MEGNYTFELARLRKILDLKICEHCVIKRSVDRRCTVDHSVVPCFRDKGDLNHLETYLFLAHYLDDIPYNEKFIFAGMFEYIELCKLIRRKNEKRKIR